MKKFDGWKDHELQQARREATARYLAVAEALKKEAGVEIHEICKSLSGRAWAQNKRIKAPEGRTRNQLYILAHECGHVALGHRRGSRPSHRMEYEAEIYAHAALRRHEIPVPRKQTERAKGYVRKKITQAKRRGAKRIDSEASAWCGYGE